MHTIIKYFYYIFYLSKFTGFCGSVFGLINGYYEAKYNTIKYQDEFITFYDIINEYCERIIKKGIFFGLIVFCSSILLLVLFPVSTIYFGTILLYNKMINFFYLIKH
jgi:hypothetical protein